MRKDVLYESVKRFVKTRKEDLNAFFTTSLRMRKFEISCCVNISHEGLLLTVLYTVFINGGRTEWPGFEYMKTRLGRPRMIDYSKNGLYKLRVSRGYSY